MVDDGIGCSVEMVDKVTDIGEKVMDGAAVSNYKVK